MIAESKSSPPIFKRRFKTSPPDERTDNSVIPPPKFAIKIPFSLKISMPKPTASVLFRQYGLILLLPLNAEPSRKKLFFQLP